MIFPFYRVLSLRAVRLTLVYHMLPVGMHYFVRGLSPSLVFSFSLSLSLSLFLSPSIGVSRRMMYGFGEEEHPLPETVACMQQVRMA